MIWDIEKQDRDILKWYKKLISLRNENIAIKSGNFFSVVCDDQLNLYGFIRKINNEETYVIINRSNSSVKTELPVLKGLFYEDLIDGEVIMSVPLEENDVFHNQDLLGYSRKLPVQLPEYSIKILKIRMEELK
jgi:hypothetical protein